MSAGHPSSAFCALPIPCSCSSSSASSGRHLFARQNISETIERTNRVVFQHAQRLVHARPLHRAVVPRHRHRDEAHHDGAGLCCYIVSPLFLFISSSRPFSLFFFHQSNPIQFSASWLCAPRGKGRGAKGKVAGGNVVAYLSSPCFRLRCWAVRVRGEARGGCWGTAEVKFGVR
jgi:hypothetical protein